MKGRKKPKKQMAFSPYDNKTLKTLIRKKYDTKTKISVYHKKILNYLEEIRMLESQINALNVYGSDNRLKSCYTKKGGVIRIKDEVKKNE